MTIQTIAQEFAVEDGDAERVHSYMQAEVMGCPSETALADWAADEFSAEVWAGAVSPEFWDVMAEYVNGNSYGIANWAAM